LDDHNPDRDLSVHALALFDIQAFDVYVQFEPVAWSF
jgi:hypothetical protein